MCEDEKCKILVSKTPFTFDQNKKYYQCLSATVRTVNEKKLIEIFCSPPHEYQR